jgi:hypothetical protein
MFSKRKSFNQKRRISPALKPDEIQRLVRLARYGGNPEHKKNPGDFGLTPPASPRPDKTLCDSVAIFKRKEAARLLKEGIRRGLISAQVRNGYPQNIWAVSPSGIPLEAQQENSNDREVVYHGYPMPESDPFRKVVLKRWGKNS